MKRAIAILLNGMLVATLTIAQVSIKDLEGTRTRPIDLSFLLVLMERGIDSIGHSAMTRDCTALSSPGTKRIAIENGSISISYITLVGVNTIEKSIALFTRCAALGVFLLETITPLPLAGIYFYVLITVHLTFIDAIQLDDLKCVILRRDEEEANVPSILDIKCVSY